MYPLDIFNLFYSQCFQCDMIHSNNIDEGLSVQNTQRHVMQKKYLTFIKETAVKLNLLSLFIHCIILKKSY